MVHLDPWLVTTREADTWLPVTLEPHRLPEPARSGSVFVAIPTDMPHTTATARNTLIARPILMGETPVASSLR
jgi:hypothetical protein